MNQISPTKRKDKPFYFSKSEFHIIIGAYSMRVAKGQWRDYALDHTPKVAYFSIFRNTHETPYFVIEKHRPQGKEDPLFILRDRNRALCRSTKIERIIKHFDRLPILVKA